jgi:hypothetical protein
MLVSRGEVILPAVLIALAMAITASAAGPAVDWTQTFGDTLNDHAYAVTRAHDFGYVVVGEITNPWPGSVDLYIAKVDYDGDVLWERSYGGSAEDIGYSIDRTTDGGYVIAGATGYNPFSWDVYLVKVDGDGYLEWDTILGGPSEDMAYGVRQTPDGGYVITGDTDSFGQYENVYVGKTDSSGNPDWEVSLGLADDHGEAIVLAPGGGYVIGGWRGDGNTFPEFNSLLMKVSEAGSLVWQREFDESVDDRGYALVATVDGGYALAGQNLDAAVWKTDSAGLLDWSVGHGTGTSDHAFGIREVPGGGYFMAGQTVDYDYGLQYYAVRVDADGGLLWDELYGGPQYDWCRDVELAPDGGYVMVGSTQSYGEGGYDAYVIKLEPDGTAGVPEEAVDELALSRPSASPFSNETSIALTLAHPSEVSVRVYDPTGRLVRTLHDGPVAAGTTELTFVGRDEAGRRLASGVYFIVAENGMTRAARKAIILR